MWNLTDLRLFLATVQYEHPHLIWWAMPAAAFTAVLFFVWWRARVNAIKLHGDLNLVTIFTKLPSRWLAIIGVGMVLAVVLGFAAATMPYQSLGAISVPSGSLHIVAVDDGSKSMAGEDHREDQTLFGGASCGLTDGPCGNRISTGKLILMKQIMPVVKDNQIGLIVYSGSAVTLSPLTDDFQTLLDMLTTWHWVDVGAGLGEGSYIDQGLLAAVDVLKQGAPKEGQPPVQNIILLTTDGGNSSSPEEMEKAVKAVKEADARLIIIGLGSDKETAIPLYDGKGKPKYNDRGQRAYFDVEEGQTTARDDAAMEKLAAEADGQYLKVTPGKPLVINWPTALGGSRVVIAKHYLYQYPLAGTVAIIALIWLGSLWSFLLQLLAKGLRLPLGRRTKH